MNEELFLALLFFICLAATLAFLGWLADRIEHSDQALFQWIRRTFP